MRLITHQVWQRTRVTGTSGILTKTIPIANCTSLAIAKRKARWENRQRHPYIVPDMLFTVRKV